MTTRLSELLHESVDQDAPEPHADRRIVEAAWAGGRRRRLRRRTKATAMVVVVLALLTALVAPYLPGEATGPALPASTSNASGLTHPQRIGHQAWVGQLPERIGAIAGVVQVSGEWGIDDWQAFLPSGTRYRLPGSVAHETVPVVSADGTRVAYAQQGFARYVVADLRTGARWFIRVPGIQLPGQMPAQLPSFFSPSGDRVALPAVDGPIVFDTSTLNGVGDVAGAVDRRPTGMTMAYGWLDDDRLVGRGLLENADAEAEQRLVVWDRRTGVTTPGPIVRAPEGREPAGQWSGAVRPDGVFVLRSMQRAFGSTSVTAFRIDGESATPVRLPSSAADEASAGTPGVDTDLFDAIEVCPIAFDRDGGPVVSRYLGDDPYPRLEVVRIGTPHDVRRTVVDISAACVVWAQESIAGPATWQLFGSSDSWLAQWWHGLALLGVLGVAFVLWRRRRA